MNDEPVWCSTPFSHPLLESSNYFINMSLAKRLLHPHYVTNTVLALAYPAYQIISHPEYLNTESVAAYSRYLLPALILLTIKVRGSQSAEELVSVVALYIKVYSLYGFWSIAKEKAILFGMEWSGWWRAVLYLFTWLGKLGAAYYPLDLDLTRCIVINISLSRS